ncbi:hypothetical protein ACJX0J_011840, partial [Zea mays]
PSEFDKEDILLFIMEAGYKVGVDATIEIIWLQFELYVFLCYIYSTRDNLFIKAYSYNIIWGYLEHLLLILGLKSRRYANPVQGQMNFRWITKKPTFLKLGCIKPLVKITIAPPKNTIIKNSIMSQPKQKSSISRLNNKAIDATRL